MQRALAALMVGLFLLPAAGQNRSAQPAAPAQPQAITGFRDVQAERQREKTFLAVPDAQRAGEHLRILTSAPHMAATPEDHKTAEYVAEQFRAAGLQTKIVEYKVWLAGRPHEVSLEIVYPKIARQAFQLRERVDGDKY